MSEGKPVRYSPGARWLILTLVAAAAVAVSSGIGILPTYRMAGPAAAIAMGVAAVVVWAVSAAGAIPVALWRESDPRAVLLAVQLGMGVRFVLTLAVAVALALGTTLPRTPLLLWIGIHYVVVLTATTVTEVWLLRRRQPEASA
jgi:hypothetical protein